MPTASTIPDERADLIHDANYGALGTIRPDDTVQVNPMWFDFDGTNLRFTHTTKRGKFRNLQSNPSMSFSIFDPANPYRWVEVRGSLIEVRPDPEGEYYVHLGRRYGNAHQEPPADKADRVVLVMSVEKVAW